MSLDLLLSEAFEVFEEAALKYRTFVIAFSGGKDSTAAAILFYKWAKRRNGVKNRVVLLHNDTLSEIPEMELWVDHFARQFKAKMRELGTDVHVRYAYPHPTETWYWRVLVRGYPAPTFNFRWCVDMLKIEPTERELRRHANHVLVVGSRDEESGARAKSMKTRFGTCSGGGSCLGAYFSHGDIPKIAPIRFWTYDMVWSFLRAQKDFDVQPLEELYRGLAAGGSLGGRYGCWHCTLVRVQAANYSRPEYLYAEAVRTIYRALSDMGQHFREPKNTGYSRWGPLNAHARSIIYHAIKAAEELAGRKIFYGLDRAAIYGYTLRQIFYEMDPQRADAIIRRADPTDRRIPTAELRRLDKTHLAALDSYLSSQNHRDEKTSQALRQIITRLKENTA
ncbi:phosphoadenosine phosphosulfate reductase family protein [Pyrobaculum neutrophilum]|uniref:Phosphoadenosine phosphosulfate reductase n=1 Tax=Pyrobaculum neutrophilum (strain DSM 2338 / JCM 9278 / NBRC 100436 / V24Sta) TaxID=444157 RepID=B1YE28_PYRNV|nr:phosphoadenosine phosphosulfate reductase family protein [Pyrobaculum neutrophilum]ACB40041.1 phosphoadenosine phosphosulfate reductase [Pyrobaculum neutrophilum V24Sta]